MAEIVDPWILDPEGFCFKLEKTEGFWEGNSKMWPLHGGNTRIHSHFLNFLHFLHDFK